MADFTIEHERKGCIGCGACAAVNPDFWIMSSADGKSDLKGAEHIAEGGQTVREKLDIEKANYQKNREAADCCPVNVIHILDKKTGEKII